MSITSLGATATSALSHALGHKHAHKPEQVGGSMADLLAQLTGGSSSQGSAQSGSAQSSGAGSTVGKLAQDLLSMLGIGQEQAKPAASAASAYAAGTNLG